MPRRGPRGGSALFKRGFLWHSSQAVLLALQLAAISWLTRAAPLEIRSHAVDPALTEAGLRARTTDLEAWTITVDDSEEANQITVHLQTPGRHPRQLQLVLTGHTREDRSRELAASLALLIDLSSHPPPDPAPLTHPPLPPTTTHDRPAPPKLRAFVALGPRLELGRGLLVDGGLNLELGALLRRDHLQPLLGLGLAGAQQSGVSLLHLRFGAGLALGAPLAPRIWLGGHVLIHALWLRAHDARTADVWSSSSDLGALLQYRGRRLYFGLRTGIDLTLPPLNVLGERAQVRRGPARWFFGLGLGLTFG